MFCQNIYIIRTLLPCASFLITLGVLSTFYTNKIHILSENTIKVKPVILNKIKQQLYIVTPTYRRSSQLPDMTRLSQTLMHVANLHWIVVQDAEEVNHEIQMLLKRSGISHTYMAVKTKSGENNVRGLPQRNLALNWIQNTSKAGVVYFADDDNTYDLRLFEELRKIRRVGILPVGHLINCISSPVVVNGKIIKFYDPWTAGRKFPIDLACCGVNVKFWFERQNPLFKYSQPGFLETKFMENLGVEKEDFELLADNCSKIFVWHTQTKDINYHFNINEYNSSNIVKMVQNIKSYQ